MKAFSTFKNKNWCIDLAYVDKLANDNKGVKYVLDLFDRTVDAKWMEMKNSKETFFCGFFTMITKNKRPTKTWVDKGTKLAGKFKKLCAAEGLQVYSTMRGD